TRLALGRCERPEPGKCHAVTGGDRSLNRVDERVERFFRVALGEAAAFVHRVDQLGLVQDSLRVLFGYLPNQNAFAMQGQAPSRVLGHATRAVDARVRTLTGARP